ncbi:MAG: NUDIX hydrolase [Rickettsiales bacterium]|nr:NUDIX hydrolase [Rickettsiales bacterium]|tara:strand:- start:3180 stop:3767 length:588 start_codon:yes stop_codon:yes gene_type:complete
MNPSVLRSQLEAYLPQGTRDRRQQQRMLELLNSSAQPFSRSNLSPGHFTASALVLDPSAERLLLILHRSLGLWLQPGGHFENGDENLEAAVLRELSEETGLLQVEALNPDCQIFDIDIHNIPANPSKGEGPHQHFDLRMAFRAHQVEFKKTSEVNDIAWVDLSQLEQLHTDESVLRCAKRLQQRRQSCSASLELL